MKAPKEELLKFILEKKSICSIARYYSVTNTTIYRWLANYDIDVHKKYICNCGETNPENFTKGRHNQCKECRNRWQIRTYKKYKLQAIEYKGGKCIQCGYNKCSASLDFHHKNPKEKDISWTKMHHWKFDKIKEELDKCDLLCKNCHGELHYL